MARELINSIKFCQGEVDTKVPTALILSFSRNIDQSKLLMSILDKKMESCHVEDILTKLHEVIIAESDELPEHNPKLLTRKL